MKIVKQNNPVIIRNELPRINYDDTKLKTFDFTKFNIIVFDKIYFNNLNIY